MTNLPLRRPRAVAPKERPLEAERENVYNRCGRRARELYSRRSERREHGMTRCADQATGEQTEQKVGAALVSRIKLRPSKLAKPQVLLLRASG